MKHYLKKSRTLLLVFGLLFCTLAFNSGQVFAGEGAGHGSGGTYGCQGGFLFCNEFGATWKWYPTDQDRVWIPNGPLDRGYLRGGEIRDCAKYGGYWRYAVVATPAYGGHAGEQFGLLGIGDNGWSWNSAMLGGGTYYRGPNDSYGGEDWYYVKSVYEALQRQDPATFWRGFQVGSDLSWFCGGYEPNHSLTVKYYGKETDKYCFGKEVHSPDSGEKEIAGSQTIKDENNAGSLTVDTLKSELEAQGWNFTGVDGAGLQGDNVTVDVSGGDVTVTLHFDRTREHYDDCDVNCNEWTPDEYIKSDIFQGETKVRIGVINHTLTGFNENGEWHHEPGHPTTGLQDGEIYAKPTDDVQWKYCYYPGVERAADQKVTAKGQTPNVDKEHEDPLPGLVNHQNNDQVFKDYNGWAGAEYKAWSENIKASSEFQHELSGWYDQVKSPGDDTPLMGTLPGGPFVGKANVDEDATRQYLVQPWEQPSLKAHDRNYYAQRLDPGWTLWGHIMTNKGYTHVDRTPDSQPHKWWCNEYACPTEENPGKKCHQECSHDDVYIPNHKDTHKEQDDARVIVPYNYKNKGTATLLDDGKDYLYAGETVTVEKPSITVGIRPNEVTSPDVPEGYATQVPGRARIVAFLMDKNEYETDPENSVWNGPVFKEDLASPQHNRVDDGDEGVIWRNPSEVCGTNGQKNAFNAKNGVCKYLEQYGNGSSELLNENSNFTGAVYNFAGNGDHTEPANGSINQNEVYNVFDEAAGNYFCVAAAVYPFSVNSNTDTDPNGDYSWYISKPSCKIIAKKPTFQVWGAGVFSNGAIKTSTSIKNNVLDNDNPSGPQSGIWNTTDGYDRMQNNMEGSSWGLNWRPLYSEQKGQNTLFGSWGELDVTSKGMVSEMASGAGTGYRGGYLWGDSTWNKQADMAAEIGKGNPGGVQRDAVDNFCYRSPLTIANIGCPGSTGNFAQTEVADVLSADKEYLLTRFTPEGANASTYDYITDPSSLTSGGTIEVQHGKTVIHVVPSGTTINSNIHYDQDNMQTLADVPKYFIRAQGDLNIGCEVTRLDAIIIADGTVNTCADTSDGGEEHKNDPKRSHQLVVNGTIVANRIEMNRSFGMGTGIHSMTPAELINYDSSIYLWANRQAEGGQSGQMTEKTIRELAPRY